ncbi:hypothetical protein O0L34_g8850 [Tuta absoluta]|nr:hypothetical protein O0L34_g8850 [Tuta absoluta]
MIKFIVWKFKNRNSICKIAYVQKRSFHTVKRSGDGGGARVLRSTPDWSDAAISGEHLWSPTSVSGDCCYVGDAECQVSPGSGQHLWSPTSVSGDCCYVGDAECQVSPSSGQHMWSPTSVSGDCCNVGDAECQVSPSSGEHLWSPTSVSGDCCYVGDAECQVSPSSGEHLWSPTSVSGDCCNVGDAECQVSPSSGEHLWSPTSVSGDCCYVGDAECQVSPSSGQHLWSPTSVSGDCCYVGDAECQVSPSSGQHLWSPTSVLGDCCYVGDAECQKHGSRMKCSACKIVAHQACIDILMDRVQFTCKPTFRDVGVRQYREQTLTHHHWVHRRSEKGKCKACGKSLQAKLSFSSKEIVALTCSWCKDSYHNKESCFNLQRIGEECCLGSQSNIIVPPSWIVKLPRRGSFKSSLRKSPKKKSASKKKGKDSKNEQKTFVIKPIPTANVHPVLVFINPKSGGNQGAKLLQKFQWLLNPRQVFDLTQGGPGPGLELFRKVPNLRVLACGGDGTVGWVLSVLDRIGTRPAVGVLPLGTGNDLARALGWGGGYEDEPISKILANIGESDTVLLDRWQLTVEPNTAAAGEDTSHAKPELPLNVVNNYFSFGVDAHIALEFHEAREAHPEKFNSRIRNKLFYGTAGGKDLMQRKWKGLAEFVTMECDGKDLTPVLREHRVHAIVFLNIPSYGGGTHPWNKSGGAFEPSTEDGLIEVVGLTTYQLPLLQAGGHGTCITQCKTAKIVTTKVIPMQVDGEACRLAPSTITISRLNQAIMLAKKKPGRANAPQTTLDKLTLTVNLITMSDYERHHYDKELLAKTAERVGTLEVNPTVDLEQMRALIQNMIKESHSYSNLADWWFVDSVTAERFFRIDKAQENLHYPTDIGHEHIYILDAAPRTPDTESTAHPDTTATASLDRTGPSVSLDTTTGLSVSLDITQSMDTPSAGVSLDVPESHASESGLGSPARLSEELLTPQSPPPGAGAGAGGHGGVAPKLSIPGTPKACAPLSPRLTAQDNSPPLCTSPPAKDHQPTNDSIARFKTNLLEKTTDALLKAAKIGDLKMLRELHNAGYSLMSIDASGQTALHIAARYGNKEIVKYLIASAPTSILNMRDNERGQTALHKAAAHKRRAICCMLVAGGASLTRQDHAGLTPRHLALRAEDHDLAAYLESQEHFQLVSEELETAV